MKVFEIEKGNLKFIANDPVSLAYPLEKLKIGEKLTIRAIEMTEEDYNTTFSSVVSCKFFGQWEKKKKDD